MCPSGYWLWYSIEGKPNPGNRGWGWEVLYNPKVQEISSLRSTQTNKITSRGAESYFFLSLSTFIKSSHLDLHGFIHCAAAM